MTWWPPSFPGRPPWLKPWLKMTVRKTTILGITAAVCAAVLLLLVVGIPFGFLVDTIQNRFRTETGYRLRIAEGAKISFLPSITVTASKISVIDESGRRAETRATAESARIKLTLSSLFSGRPRVTEATIVGPTFNVPLLRERTAGPARMGSSRPPAEAPIVDRFVVENGAVVFASDGGVESRLDQIAVDGSVAPDGALIANGSGRIGEQALRVTLKGSLPGSRSEGRALPFDFNIEAPGLLRDPVVGTTLVRTKGPQLTLDAVSGTIGPSRFSGEASADLAGKPFVRLMLEFQRLDLNVGDQAGAGPQGGLEQPWSDKPVILDGLNFLDAEVQVTAAELNVGRFRFAPITVGAILAKGVLSTGITRTGVYGGQAQGTIVVDASQPEPSHALRIDLTGVRASPLLSDVASFGALDGVMQARIDARGRGNNARAVMTSLGGAVDVLVQDGEIRNVNVAKMIRTLGASVINGWQADRAEKTDLSQLSAFFHLDNGRATTDNLRLVGPLVRVTGAGSADLGTKTLQFRLDPKLVMSLEGQGGTAAEPAGFGVPVVAEGTWAAPRIYPDMAGILDNPDAAYAKLNELGAGLFGSKPGQPNPLVQGIDQLLGRLGGQGSDKPAEPAKPQQPQSQPQAQSRPQPAPSQSSSQRTQPQTPPAQQSQNQNPFSSILQNLLGR